MPPKAKFSKEQITEAGLQIVREKGADSLTARALGEKLGSSSCPVFTVSAAIGNRCRQNHLQRVCGQRFNGKTRL